MARRAIFSVTGRPAYDPKDQVADLWIVATGSDQPPHKLTQTKATETGTVWSPDGKKIAFASKREGDEVPQIYVLNLFDGGEAERVTNISTWRQRAAVESRREAIALRERSLSRRGG